MNRTLDERTFAVYIMASESGTLYIGMTNDLMRRVQEHKDGTVKGFTERYRVNRLMYYELADDAYTAIVREKQLKGWVRRKKLALITTTNPHFQDLSLEWSSEY